MDKDTNPDDEGSGNTLKSKLEGTLENKTGDNISVVEINSITAISQDIQNIEGVREMVCQKMHKAMSPISAISGYLDLMKMLLEQDANSEPIERYRSKIEEGVGEIGEIIEELHDMFNKMQSETNSSRTDSNEMISETNRWAS